MYLQPLESLQRASHIIRGGWHGKEPQEGWRRAWTSIPSTHFSCIILPSASHSCHPPKHAPWCRQGPWAAAEAARTGSLPAHLLPGLQHTIKRFSSARHVSTQKPLLNAGLAAEQCKEPISLSPPRWKGRINGFMKTAKSNNDYTDWQPAATVA